MRLIQLLFSLLPSVENWQSLNSETLPFVLLITIFDLIAHYAMSKALSLADATIVIPMDFLRLPLITVLAYFLYQEAVDIFFLVGALIMLTGNMINTLNSKAQNNN